MSEFLLRELADWRWRPTRELEDAVVAAGVASNGPYTAAMLGKLAREGRVVRRSVIVGGQTSREWKLLAEPSALVGQSRRDIEFSMSELDRRATRLAERMRNDGYGAVTVRNAADLSPAERMRFGFPADWTPGVKPRRAERAQRDAGVEQRRAEAREKGAAAARERGARNDVRDEAVRLMREGESVRAVQQRLGVARSTLGYWRQRAGLTEDACGAPS